MEVVKWCIYIYMCVCVCVCVCMYIYIAYHKYTTYYKLYVIIYVIINVCNNKYIKDIPQKTNC